MGRFSASVRCIPKGKERPRASIPWTWVKKWLRGGERGRKPIPHVYTSREYERWEDQMADELRVLWRREGHRKALDEPCSLLLVLWFPRPKSKTRKRLPNEPYPAAVKPDADNVAKAVQDAMEKAAVLHNDSRVFDLRVVKWVCGDDQEPGIELTLRWGPGCTLLR